MRNFTNSLKIIWVGTGIFFVIQLLISSIEYSGLYTTCLVSYFFVGSLLIIRDCRKPIDVFEPFMVITVLYLFIFCIAPMIDILNGNYYTSGVNTFASGIKGTVLFDIGYLFFYFGYNTNNRGYLYDNEVNDNYIDTNKAASLALGFWFVCWVFSVLYLFSIGKGITYILSWGFNGTISEGSDTTFGFLSVFADALPTLLLIYFNYGRSKVLKIAMLLLTLNYFWLRGFRYIFVIIGMAYAANIYIKRKNRPNIPMMILIITIGISILALVGNSRGMIRSGVGVIGNTSGIQQIMDNFGIYKTYYAIVGCFPEKLNYLHGRQMILYTLVMFIPRAIWPGKPISSTGGVSVMEVAINSAAASGGNASPHLGEMYMEFGPLGIIVIMYIFGRINKRLFEYGSGEINSIRLSVYCVLMSAMFQVVIRSYTPSHFYMLLLMLLSGVIVEKHSRIL